VVRVAGDDHTRASTEVGDVLMGLGGALRLFRQSTNPWDAISATPPGAMRPSSTFWFDPAGRLPPVTWVPPTGEFSTHWDSWCWTMLGIPGVWRARMLISQAIGGMPIQSYRGTEPTPPPAILREPNPGEDRCNTVAAWVCDLLDHGNAVGVITTRDPAGNPVSLQPVPAALVEIGRAETGAVQYKIGQSVYGRSDVFHAKGMSAPGEIRGWGVLEAHLNTLTRVQSEQDYASKAFRSGVPSGLIRVKDPDLQEGSDDDPAGTFTAKGIKKGWVEAFSGGPEPAVLSELVDYEPIAWTPKDAQMVEARQLSLTDIANCYNLDAYWLNAPSTSMTYQNVQTASMQLSRFTLGPWITALEAQFSRLLVRGQDARFNRDSILRDDTATRYGNYKTGLDGGWLTLDEVRASEGFEPLPEEEPAPTLSIVPADGDPATGAAQQQESA
jgi:HK97 family phage portal protein